MKAKANLNSRFLGLACTAFWLALQFPCARLCSLSELRDALESPGFASAHSARMSLTSEPRSSTKETSLAMYGELPLSFEANCGQANSQVKFLSRGRTCQLFLTSNEAVMQLRTPANLTSNSPKHKSIGTPSRPSAVRMKLVGANAARIVGLDELPGKSNYFIGNDPKKWRTNVPTYSRVKYEGIYPGVDIVFYGMQGQLEYDLVVAPGASFNVIRLAFDGARCVRVDESGDLLIETPVGEIRQRKPVIYQLAGGAKRPVSGGYAIRGKQEVGFELGDHDTSRSLVIDPVLVYSTSIGGFYNDSANAVALDPDGNAYIAGVTNSLDFPTVNPFQPRLKVGTAIGIPSEAFIAKLNPSGTALVYSTFLGGGSFDGANGIAVDSSGNAYVTGFSASRDFPTTPNAFQPNPMSGGVAFVTKLNPTGDNLTYSTYLGGATFFGMPASVGNSIAIDIEGNAYVTGYTSSNSFPTKRAVQDNFNGGQLSTCCSCFIGSGPFVPPFDAFVTKLNPSGSELVYSTFLGGTGQDEGRGIAVDSSGSAYVTGRTCSRDFPGGSYAGGRSDAFLVKLSPTGREFIYSKLFGGSGNDLANGIAVDSSGNSYVTGETGSIDLAVTQGAFQMTSGGSVSYMTNDGGNTWSAASGLPNSPMNALTINPLNPSSIYACLASGVFKSTDGGQTWRPTGLASFVQAMAIDPKSPSTIYAGRYKSTDEGNTWNVLPISKFSLFSIITGLAIDPINTATVYLIASGSDGGDVLEPPAFLKSTDSGSTWTPLRAPGFNSLAIDPKNPSTLYVSSFSNLYKSTDGGTTWRSPQFSDRNLVVLAVDPANTSTLYARDTPDNSGSLSKSTDGGITFRNLQPHGGPIRALVVSPADSATLFAAEGYLGNGGRVFKSTDAGETWSATDLVGMTVNALAIDPQNSSRLYAGTYSDTDAFLAKINPTGALIYSTYLGTRSPDFGAAIGVDDVGNAYVTGKTFSDRFLAKDALQTMKPSGPFDTATFVTKLNATGSQILFSTYLGSEPSFGSAIAVDAAGRAYVAGTTGQLAIVPSARLPESVHGGYDAFVMKIASPPQITGASVIGKNLVVTGEGFDKGAVILVDGVEQRTRNDQSSPTRILLGKKTAKSIPPGQKVGIQVRSSNGLISGTFSFTRPP